MFGGSTHMKERSAESASRPGPSNVRIKHNSVPAVTGVCLRQVELYLNRSPAYKPHFRHHALTMPFAILVA